MTGAKSRLGVLALARPRFDVAYAREVARAAFRTLERLDVELIGHADLLFDADSTEEALKQFTDLEALLLLQATFTDSSMTDAIGARFDAPIILWAFPEERSGGRLRLNSFCGVNLAAYALVNAGKAFSYIHRAPEDPTALGEIEKLLANGIGQASSRRRPAQVNSAEARLTAASVATQLATTKIGVIGDRPDGFDPCGYDPLVLHAVTGVEVERRDLEDLFAAASSVTEDDLQVTASRAACSLDGLDQLDQPALKKSLSLYDGLRTLIEEGDWSGVATRCWPECFTEYGGAACAPQSMLADDGVPGTCEADVYGNVTALILQEIGGEPAFVADMVEVDSGGRTGVLWHCGLAPTHMATPNGSPVATIHSNRKLPLLNQFALRPGRVTLARLSQAAGMHALVIGGGTMLDSPLPFSGTAGVIEFDRPAREVTATIMREGLEHHFGIVYGDHQFELEALAAQWGIPVVDL